MKFQKTTIKKVLEISDSTFRLWAKELILVEPLGQGKRRSYDGPEFTMFAIVKILSKRGFPLKDMRPLFRALKQFRIRPLLDPFIDKSIYRRHPLILRIHAFFDGVEIFEIITRGVLVEYRTVVELIKWSREEQSGLTVLDLRLEEGMYIDIDLKWVTQFIYNQITYGQKD